MDGFYTHIYGLMTLYPDWYPGHNLDALNDMSYIGFGNEEVTLMWLNSDKSRKEPGIEKTIEFYQKKIDQGAPYNVLWAKEKILDWKMETGKHCLK